MPTFFADSGYWIALWNSRDALHEKALSIADERSATDEILTTRMVLIEALDALSGSGEFRRRIAAREVEALEDDPSVEIIPLSDDHFQSALRRYAARSDQRWGLTDCASFLIMEQRDITQALAYDRDFEQAGFTALLRQDRA